MVFFNTEKSTQLISDYSLRSNWDLIKGAVSLVQPFLTVKNDPVTKYILFLTYQRLIYPFMKLKSDKVHDV